MCICDADDDLAARVPGARDLLELAICYRVARAVPVSEPCPLIRVPR